MVRRSKERAIQINRYFSSYPPSYFSGRSLAEIQIDIINQLNLTVELNTIHDILQILSSNQIRNNCYLSSNNDETDSDYTTESEEEEEEDDVESSMTGLELSDLDERFPPFYNISPSYCSICYQNTRINELMRRLTPCRHSFHADCISNHLINYDSRCPICREEYG